MTVRHEPKEPEVQLPVERLDAIMFDLDTVLPSGNEAHGGSLAAFADTVRLLVGLRDLGMRTAAMSSHRPAREGLAALGMDGLFTVVVDGLDADRLGVSTEPDPGLVLRVADLVGVHPARTALVAETHAPVEAGCRGGFG